MTRLTRRSFLSGAALPASSAASTGPATTARTRRVPLTRSWQRVVVIGSGFGAGWPRCGWPEVAGRPLGLEPYVGLLEPVVGENLTAIVAAGVGGGSLVYQGMTLQPDRDAAAGRPHDEAGRLRGQPDPWPVRCTTR